ncbi:DUF1107 family protein [Salmonella enterica subsp. enterica]|nr:DUF1107 family protein [Salmonella enterica subsp. enterica]
MKIFQRYNPLQVAKYVKILFRGRLYIMMLALLSSIRVRFLSKSERQAALAQMFEVNRQVMRLAN